MGICCTTPEFRPPSIRRKPLVRMCSSGNHFSNFADIGDTVVLFVDFGKLLKPLPRRNQEHSLGGATAGKVWPDQRHQDPEKEQYEVSTKMSNQHLIFPREERGGEIPKNFGGGVSLFCKPLLWYFRPKYVIFLSQNLISYFRPDCICNNSIPECMNHSLSWSQMAQKPHPLVVHIPM